MFLVTHDYEINFFDLWLFQIAYQFKGYTCYFAQLKFIDALF